MKLSQLNEAFERLNEAEDNSSNELQKRYSALSTLKDRIASIIDESDLRDLKKMSLCQNLLTVIVRLTAELGKTNNSNLDLELKYVDKYIKATNDSIKAGKLMIESLHEDLEKDFSLNEEKMYNDLSSDFNINDLDNEFAKRVEKYKELISEEDEVENHYIQRFRLDLALIEKMLEEDFKQLDTTDEAAVKELFNNIDFRIKHASGYVGLPG